MHLRRAVAGLGSQAGLEAVAGRGAPEEDSGSGQC
jgi:hypothetical protein